MAEEGDRTMTDIIPLLRNATESDVRAALEGVLFDAPPKTEVELLEFFNRMLDVLTGEGDQADAMDRARIASAAEQNRPGSD